MRLAHAKKIDAPVFYELIHLFVEKKANKNNKVKILK